MAKMPFIPDPRYTHDEEKKYETQERMKEEFLHVQQLNLTESDNSQYVNYLFSPSFVLSMTSEFTEIIVGSDTTGSMTGPRLTVIVTV